VLIIDMSTADPFWSTHPMTRYPVLRAFLGEYRVETVIDGKTIIVALTPQSNSAHDDTKARHLGCLSNVQ